jgi:hypothetical protein
MSESEKDAEIARLKQLLKEGRYPPSAHPSELLEDLARQTWHRIQDGHRLQIRQGETAISDYLLLQIARAQFPNIKIIKTSPTKEASQGTDWEWWVGSRRRGWIRYAMQAKRLLFPDNCYDALGHKVNSLPQIDILIEYAQANNAVPLYCLYNATGEQHLNRYWHCNLPFELEQLGCTVAPALAVKTCLSKRGQRTFRAVHNSPGVLPWRCLVGCPKILSSYPADSKGTAQVPLSLAPNGFAIVHPTLPRNMEDAFQKGEADNFNFDEEFFRGNPSYFPLYLVTIDIFETERESFSENDFYR